ncbi:MAG TPA: class I SAM-dependent methyltransferase [Phycisphaerales bacterium]|nr:class I SAM-dependent methyltransferase [Phycisphaerales bacterium]
MHISRRHIHFLVAVGLLWVAGWVVGQHWTSTRVADPGQWVIQTSGRYPYRERGDFVLAELDLRNGDTVLDIGAGDGYWTEKMAQAVGPEGRVYAGEVEQRQVERLQSHFGDLAQVEPYLCPMDNTGLAENTCDLVFLSQTWHHIDQDVHEGYLKHLRSVVRPTGRLCIIERYLAISQTRSTHGTQISRLTAEAESTGWILLRHSIIPGTDYFMAVFVQRELFQTEGRDAD